MSLDLTALRNATAQLRDALRQGRGTTSHAHDEAKAQAVFDAIPSFISEVEFMTARLDERGAKS